MSCLTFSGREGFSGGGGSYNSPPGCHDSLICGSGLLLYQVTFLDCSRDDSRPNGGCMMLGSDLGGEADRCSLTPPGCPVLID